MTTEAAAFILAVAVLAALAFYVCVELFLDWVFPTEAMERARLDAEDLINSANEALAQRPRLSDGAPVWLYRSPDPYPSLTNLNEQSI